MIISLFAKVAAKLIDSFRSLGFGPAGQDGDRTRYDRVQDRSWSNQSFDHVPTVSALAR